MRNTGKTYTNGKSAVVAERCMGQPCKCEKSVLKYQKEKLWRLYSMIFEKKEIMIYSEMRIY